MWGVLVKKRGLRVEGQWLWNERVGMWVCWMSWAGCAKVSWNCDEEEWTLVEGVVLRVLGKGASVES